MSATNRIREAIRAARRTVVEHDATLVRTDSAEVLADLTDAALVGRLDGKHA